MVLGKILNNLYYYAFTCWRFKVGF